MNPSRVTCFGVVGFLDPDRAGPLTGKQWPFHPTAHLDNDLLFVRAKADWSAGVRPPSVYKSKDARFVSRVETDSDRQSRLRIISLCWYTRRMPPSKGSIDANYSSQVHARRLSYTAHVSCRLLVSNPHASLDSNPRYMIEARPQCSCLGSSPEVTTELSICQASRQYFADRPDQGQAFGTGNVRDPNQETGTWRCTCLPWSFLLEASACFSMPLFKRLRRQRSDRIAPVSDRPPTSTLVRACERALPPQPEVALRLVSDMEAANVRCRSRYIRCKPRPGSCGS